MRFLTVVLLLTSTLCTNAALAAGEAGSVVHRLLTYSRGSRPVVEKAMSVSDIKEIVKIDRWRWLRRQSVSLVSATPAAMEQFLAAVPRETLTDDRVVEGIEVALRCTTQSGWSQNQRFATLESGIAGDTVESVALAYLKMKILPEEALKARFSLEPGTRIIDYWYMLRVKGDDRPLDSGIGN